MVIFQWAWPYGKICETTMTLSILIHRPYAEMRSEPGLWLLKPSCSDWVLCLGFLPAGELTFSQVVSKFSSIMSLNCVAFIITSTFRSLQSTTVEKHPHSLFLWNGIVHFCILAWEPWILCRGAIGLLVMSLTSAFLYKCPDVQQLHFLTILFYDWKFGDMDICIRGSVWNVPLFIFLWAIN